MSFTTSEVSLEVPAPPPMWPGRLCFVEPTREMGRLEEELGMALIGSIGGDGPKLSVMAAGEAIRAHSHLSVADVSLVRYHPEDFLLLFRSMDAFKDAFLDEIHGVGAACPSRWAIAGDFNLILEACEKNREEA
jgi:hypothetical protein